MGLRAPGATRQPSDPRPGFASVSPESTRRATSTALLTSVRGSVDRHALHLPKPLVRRSSVKTPAPPRLEVGGCHVPPQDSSRRARDRCKRHPPNDPATDRPGDARRDPKVRKPPLSFTGKEPIRRRLRSTPVTPFDSLLSPSQDGPRNDSRGTPTGKGDAG